MDKTFAIKLFHRIGLVLAALVNSFINELEEISFQCKTLRRLESATVRRRSCVCDLVVEPGFRGPHDRQGETYVNLTDTWRNSISSIQIVKRPVFQPANHSLPVNLANRVG